MNRDIKNAISVVRALVRHSLKSDDRTSLEYVDDKAECTAILNETMEKLAAVFNRNAPMLNGDWSGNYLLRDKLLHEHSRIEQVKITREETGLPLRDTIEIVDALRDELERNREPVAGGRCRECGAPHHGTRDARCDHL